MKEITVDANDIKQNYLNIQTYIQNKTSFYDY